MVSAPPMFLPKNSIDFDNAQSQKLGLSDHISEQNENCKSSAILSENPVNHLIGMDELRLTHVSYQAGSRYNCSSVIRGWATGRGSWHCYGEGGTN